MKEDSNKKIKIWQIIALAQLVIIIFLGLASRYQQNAFAAQRAQMMRLEQSLRQKESNEKELSERLTAVVGLLQQALMALNASTADSVPAAGESSQ